MYIVLLHFNSIMTDSNSTHITETSREAFCRLVNQRIEKVTKSLENLSRLSSRKSDYSEKDVIEIVNSLSGLFSEYELLLEYLKENNIVFQKKQVDEKIAPELLRLDRNPMLLRRILEQTSERFYLSMRGLEKLDDALSQSKNLFEKKFFLERNFHNS